MTLTPKLLALAHSSQQPREWPHQPGDSARVQIAKSGERTKWHAAEVTRTWRNDWGYLRVDVRLATGRLITGCSPTCVAVG